MSKWAAHTHRLEIIIFPIYKYPNKKQSQSECGGQRNKRYLKQNHRVLYINLLTSGKLNSYLADIDKQAEEMFVLLVKELTENENVTEQLKAENQMLWMHQMNNIHNRVMEIINTDLIYV